MCEVLEEITGAFDKSEVALLLACGVRKYHEYQKLLGKRAEKDTNILQATQQEIRHQ